MESVLWPGAFVVVGLAWAYVWDQKHKRDDALFRDRMNVEHGVAAKIRDTMHEQSKMVANLLKPRQVPGDEWKNGTESE